MELYLCGFTAYYNIVQDSANLYINVILEDKTTPVNCEYNLRLSFIGDDQTHDPETKEQRNRNLISLQNAKRKKQRMIFGPVSSF